MGTLSPYFVLAYYYCKQYTHNFCMDILWAQSNSDLLNNTCMLLGML